MVTVQKRTPLTQQTVLRAAAVLADETGIETFTMRRLAEQLGVEVMSLYYHLPNKEAVLNGMVDLVFAEIAEALDASERPDAATPANWKPTLRAQILTSRSVLLRHPWAPGLIESRTSVTLGTARYLDAVVGILHAGGFGYDQIHHAMHALGSRAYGFVQEFAEPEGSPDSSMEQLEQMAALVPNLVGMLREVAHDDPTSTLGWCDDQFEFEFGLDLLLDGLERVKR